MAEQLWKGRFSKAVDSRVNDFNSSIRFDQRMIAQDMKGSGVHAAMLARQGIIPEADCEAILGGLASIADDLAAGRLEIDPAAEDVHTFVEQTLTARIGDAGKRLHTGRSRNDQVALDIRLTLRDESLRLQQLVADLVRVICRKAGENTASVMPGYTHLQRAQPVTFGHALMAYAWMLLRDLGRFVDATRRMDSQCPLGSGALAGTTYPLDRAFTAEKLGFAAPCPNSMDGVSDRDFCIELAAAISTCMMHLSRLSEEIILWCSWEFKFIELDDAFTTGSSIMPQKKNPDVTELIRGKTGRVLRIHAGREYPGQDRDHIPEDRHGHPGWGLPDGRDLGGGCHGHRVCRDLSHEPDFREKDEKYREVVDRVDRGTDPEEAGQLSPGHQLSEQSTPDRHPGRFRLWEEHDVKEHCRH